MVLTKEVRQKLTTLLDDLVKLKGIAETLDGPIIGGGLNFIDKQYGDKIPEPLQTMIRETLHKVLVDENYETLGEDLVNIVLEVIKLVGKE